jgi:hypothetical protein
LLCVHGTVVVLLALEMPLSGSRNGSLAAGKHCNVNVSITTLPIFTNALQKIGNFLEM